MVPTLHEIAAALAAHTPARLPDPATARQRAAVAILLAGEAPALRLCLIRRAEREGDPWSGHVALPGGRAQPEDAHPRAAAERETAEEIGLHLGDARFLGGIDELPLGRHGGTGAVLSAFAWHVGSACPPLEPDPRELAFAGWIELHTLWDPAAVTTIDWPWQGETYRFAGIAWDDAVLWGLTLRVLGRLAEIVGRPLPVADRPPMKRVRA